MASDDFVRSMMLGGNGPPQVKQELRVAAPMNDLQLLGIMAAIIYTGRPTPSPEATVVNRPGYNESVDDAITLLGVIATRIRSGEVIAAVRGQPEEASPE